MSLHDESRGVSHKISGSHNQQEHSEKKTHVPEDAVEYPEGLKLSLITLALCLAVFVVALDNTIIATGTSFSEQFATAIPKITDQFQSLDDVGWYGSAYLLPTAAFQLLFGKFYSSLSIKWVFVAAISVFELGSLICGVAPSSKALIIGRAIAGLGSAGIFSGAFIITANTVPLRSRALYTSLIGIMYGIASVAGPLMGGAFTDKVTWRWCFYINLPIGAVTLVVIILFFKAPGSSVKMESMPLIDRIQQFDPLGTVTFVPAIVCLLLALQWGGSKYPWDDGRIIALFILFGVLLSGFIAIQIWKQDLATVPPRIIKQRSIMTGAWFALCLGASFYTVVYFLPIWFQAIKGVSAVKSGIDNLPMILSLVISSLIAGGIITAVGYYAPFMILSAILMGAGAGLISTFDISTEHAHWIGFQVIFGLGVGFGLQQPVMAVQTVLRLQDIPIGTSLINCMQMLGGALFVSVGQNVFTNKLTTGIAGQVPGVNPAIVLRVGATSLHNSIDSEHLPAVLAVYNQSLVSAFYVAVALACLSVVGALTIEWKSVKGKNIEAAMG
ncbi:DHA14-like major facilitator [Mycena latifolia]|nr:DHA14-like major facilitator [Mycena latifolia]